MMLIFWAVFFILLAIHLSVLAIFWDKNDAKQRWGQSLGLCFIVFFMLFIGIAMIFSTEFKRAAPPIVPKIAKVNAPQKPQTTIVIEKSARQRQQELSAYTICYDYIFRTSDYPESLEPHQFKSHFSYDEEGQLTVIVRFFALNSQQKRVSMIAECQFSDGEYPSLTVWSE